MCRYTTTTYHCGHKFQTKTATDSRCKTGLHPATDGNTEEITADTLCPTCYMRDKEKKYHQVMEWMEGIDDAKVGESSGRVERA